MLTICEVPGCPGGFLFPGTPPPQGHRCLREEEEVRAREGRGKVGNIKGKKTDRQGRQMRRARGRYGRWIKRIKWQKCEGGSKEGGGG